MTTNNQHAKSAPDIATFNREFASRHERGMEEGEAYEGAWDAVIAQFAAEGRQRAAEFTSSPHWHGSPFTEEQLDQFQALSAAMIQSARLAGERARWEAFAAGVTHGTTLAALIESAVEREMARWMAGGRGATAA
jgi:hypothetical protein